MKKFVVRNATVRDIDELYEIELLCWDKMQVGKSLLCQRIEQYPAGQWIATIDNVIIGCIYTQIIENLQDLMLADTDYMNNHLLHKTNGGVLQLISVSVLPKYAHLQVGKSLRDTALMSAKFNPSIKTVVAMTRCSSVPSEVTAKSYYDYVMCGNDPTLKFHISAGASIIAIRENYRSTDTSNFGHAVLIQYVLDGCLFSQDIESSGFVNTAFSSIHPIASHTNEMVANETKSIDTLDVNINLKSILLRSIETVVPLSINGSFVDIMDTSFMSLGLDSLNIMELQSQIQNELRSSGSNIAFSVLSLFDYPTPSKLLKYLETIQNNPYGSDISAKVDEASAAAYSNVNENISNNDNKHDIDDDNMFALVSMSCRFPGSDGTVCSDTSTFFQNLCDGMHAISIVPKTWNCRSQYAGFLGDDVAECFDPNFYGISSTEANEMDPHQKILLDISYEAIIQLFPSFRLRNSDSNSYNQSSVFDDYSIGVFVGFCNNEWIHSYETNAGSTENPKSSTTPGPFTNMSIAQSAVANRISYIFGLTGPSLVVDTACSSSLAALHTACNSLRNDDCHIALVAAADLLISDHCIKVKYTINISCVLC